MWRNAAPPHTQASGLDEHPLPIPVLLQQLMPPCTAAAAGSEEPRAARCHTDVPIPCPCQACRVGCPGTLHAAGAAQAARPPRSPLQRPCKGARRAETTVQSGFPAENRLPQGCSFCPQRCWALGCGSNSAARGTKPKLSFFF